ncbi:MAG: PIN domain-containing protein [Terrimicrobiaceae bacterium]
MKILLDCDVLLDVALDRQPFVELSAEVLLWAETEGDAVVAWHSLANCAYLLKDGGREFLKGLLQIVDVAPVATADAERALALPMSDLEDALQAASALSAGASFIITRNLLDYALSPVPAISPEAFAGKLSEG